MGEESVITSVTEVTEVSAPTENTGEQTAVENTENVPESTDISAMETAENENVPLEHFEETEVPDNAEMNNDDIISSIVADAVSQSLEEAGVSETETVQTEVSVFSEAVIPETSAEVIESVIAEEVQTEAVSEVIQETKAVTEAVAETVQPSGNVGSFLIQNPTFIAFPAVIAVLAGAMAFVKKRSKKTAVTDDDAPMSARDRDAVRLATDKPDKKKGKKAKRDKKGREKLYCSPDYFDFKKDYFMFNDKYAKVLYIREYPSTATSDILTGLLGTGIEIMVTINIETYDSAEARKLVQHQITAVDTDMAKREVKAAQHGNFSSQMPQRIKNQRDAMVSVFDKITVKDQKLFMVNTQILIKADTFDELNESVEVIESTLKRSGCIKGEMAWEQEHGMADCLPLGYQRKFDYLRTMPSESVAIFMPFNVREVQMEHATYYGMNVLSHNLILFDRVTGLINPSGFYLAASGGGKSFKVKTEITNIITGDENADVLVIDPEREYWKLAEAFGGEVVRFSNGSTNYINMFDFDFRLLDDPEVDIIADKCQLVTSFISCMDAKHPLNAQEKSFVDRCVQKAYAKSGVLKSLDPKDMPTLGTFLECMKEETENVPQEMKDKLIITIDMYVNGSAKYFNNQTNVNTKNRFIAYDIRDLNGNLKTQSMLLILDYIWNRLAENKEKGRKTYIFIDEAHLLFADEYSLDYLQMLWKRARKYGGILTGITQNVDDLLKDYKSRNMLANSEFIVLLKQNPTDAAKLQDVLNINDSEIQFVNDVPAGHGLLILGGKTKIPFYDEFPKDTKLYSLMTTNFSETAKMLHQNEDENITT